MIQESDRCKFILVLWLATVQTSTLTLSRYLFKKVCLFIYFSLFFTVLELHHYTQTSPSCGKWGLLFLVGQKLLIAVVLWSWSMGSRVLGLIYCSMWAQECWLSNCGTWAQLPCSGWDLDGPGIGIMPSALASEFITTGPEGSPLMVL